MQVYVQPFWCNLTTRCSLQIGILLLISHLQLTVLTGNLWSMTAGAATIANFFACIASNVTHEFYFIFFRPLLAGGVSDKIGLSWFGLNLIEITGLSDPVAEQYLDSCGITLPWKWSTYIFNNCTDREVVHINPSSAINVPVCFRFSVPPCHWCTHMFPTPSTHMFAVTRSLRALRLFRHMLCILRRIFSPLSGFAQSRYLLAGCGTRPFAGVLVPCEVRAPADRWGGTQTPMRRQFSVQILVP